MSSPKFQQIKRRLIADIESGLLAPGSRVASETELMQRHNVARMTVVRSLNELAADGYLVRMRGKGTFVRVRPQDNLNRALAAFALVLPEVRDGFYPSLIGSFGDAAGQLNHQILTCNTDNNVEKQGNTILQLIDNRVAGVALVPTTSCVSPVHHVRQLQANRIPVVQLHRGVTGAAAPLIAWDHGEAGRLAASALVAAGHRRIAFFATHASSSADAYAVGLTEVLRNVGTQLPETLVHYGERSRSQVSPEHEAGIEEALKQMLALPSGRRPTAIFSTWDSDGELIYLALSKLGIRVPEDTSVVSVGGAWRHSAIARRLTCVVADEGYAGRAAVELLDAMSTGSRPLDEPLRLTIPLGWHAGATLARCSE